MTGRLDLCAGSGKDCMKTTMVNSETSLLPPLRLFLLRSQPPSTLYERSPLRRRASWMSLAVKSSRQVSFTPSTAVQQDADARMMVTRLAWIAARLVSSKSETRYASADSWSAITADDWKRRSVLKSCAISRTRRWKLSG